MSKKNKLMALCVTVLCSQCLHAQPRVMSIGQLFTLADQNSVSLQAWRTQEAAAEEALKAAQAQRLPDISVSATASYWGNGHLWDRNFSNGSQIRMPHFGNNFALEAQQTVYAGGAVSSSIELARLQKQMATLERARNRQDVRFLMLGLYLNLYKQYNQLTVLRNHLKLTRQVLERMHARNEQARHLEQNQASIRLAEAAVELARLNLSYTAVIATCDGMTGRKEIHEGQLVQPGQTMVEIVDNSDLWVIANFRETQMPHIRPGAQVKVTADAVPGVSFSGKVESVSNATGAAFSIMPHDNATGNFVKVEQRVPVRISLRGNDARLLQRLKAGYNVECSIKY